MPRHSIYMSNLDGLVQQLHCNITAEEYTVEEDLTTSRI